MFPLAGKDFPRTAAQLAAAIRDALAEVLSLQRKDAAVSVDGGGFPAVTTLKVDLNGAAVSATEPPPRPTPAGERQPGVEVEHLEVTGHPIKYQQSKLDLDVKASGVKLDFARDKTGRPLLVLSDAKEGRVDARISKADIEALVKSVAAAAAKQQGVTIQDLTLTLTSHGARSLAADVRVKAKKLFMSGVLHIRGRLDVDDDLNATLSGLDATGEGVIGSMASGIVDSKLKPYEGKKIPLMAFSLGDVALRDLKISAQGDAVQVSAAFGSA